ncbi:MAG: HAMP domain-containing sensor histidine kinase [bacterium]
MAELKTLAEVQLKWPEKETEKQFLEEVLEVVNQMQKMVATILTQVRAEAKVNPINVSSVDIKTVILDVVKSHKKIIEDKKIHLTVLSEEKTYDIKTDPDMLNSIINNLFDNAVQYCQEGGLVTSKIEKLNGNIKISITNTNDILEPEDLKHIFEPLWRKSTSRTSRENTGLGLAIVKTFCELLDIKLEIKILDNKDFYAGLSIKKTNP